MIYAINIPEIKDLGKCLEIFKENGDFIYTDKVIYINTNLSLEFFKKAIRNILGIEAMFIAFEINENNVYKQSPNAKNWILDIFRDTTIQEEKKRFEIDYKESLERYSNMLDYLEENLNNKLSEKLSQGKE